MWPEVRGGELSDLAARSSAPAETRRALEQKRWRWGCLLVRAQPLEPVSDRLGYRPPAVQPLPRVARHAEGVRQGLRRPAEDAEDFGELVRGHQARCYSRSALVARALFATSLSDAHVAHRCPRQREVSVGAQHDPSHGPAGRSLDAYEQLTFPALPEPSWRIRARR